MSVQLHPDIEQLDRSSLCYSIYSQLYHNFFNAQQKKDAEHPYGVEEGDETSVRLKNTAYGFVVGVGAGYEDVLKVCAVFKCVIVDKSNAFGNVNA